MNGAPNISRAIQLAVMLVVLVLVADQGQVVSTPAEVSAVLKSAEPSYHDRQGHVLDPSAPALQALLQRYDGDEKQLTLDDELQATVYEALRDIAFGYGYAGGAGVVMDVKTGELLALVDVADAAADTSLHRALEGLYAPGSTIKPFLALAALEEGLITPETEILSTGAIALRGQGQTYVYRDWKAHGLVDMRSAIGVSSNVYFYTIGGGHEEQLGLGIERIRAYLERFGFGSPTGIVSLADLPGQVPGPEWKVEQYPGSTWQLGDTYLVSIGQHGYQVTPLQLTRATAVIANAGWLVTPRLLLLASSSPKSAVSMQPEHFKVIQEGMELAVREGTAAGLYLPGISVAAKTGTTEVDVEKTLIHSWVTGYFPVDEPRYAFTFMLENGPWGEEVGAVAAGTRILSWVQDHRTWYTE